jgi:hypothetical protein
MEVKTKQEAVIEVVNKLFIYTDAQQWNKLISEVFKETILFDMSSMGAGPAKKMSANAVCDMWKDGFKDIDHIHHQAGNYLVEFSEDGEADILCYAIALHYKKSATKGQTREFVGSYTLHASFTDQGWRLDSFKYALKFVSGNADLN